MNIPSFTAETSLYRSRNLYRITTLESNASLPAGSIMPALTKEGDLACQDCEQSCAEVYSVCLSVALATVWIPWLGGGIGVACTAESWYCLARCHAEGHACCPKDCGGYCCSYGEQCSNSGCCPSDRITCGGKCCAKGESCCGDTCCAPGFSCCGGTCCPNACCGDTCCGAGIPCCGDRCCSFPNTPPPPPPPNNCIFGGVPCGTKCCPPGLQCCNFFNGQPDCKTSCLH